MLEHMVDLETLVASILVGYLLGSIPFAHLAARLKGVDIFETGSTRAGTANLFWNVGRRLALLVFLADVAKGSLAIFIAGLMDINGSWMLAAGAGSILGHWKSIFTNFRGGDGMATLIGVSLAMSPILAFISGIIGLLAVIICWKFAFRSALGLTVSFLIMIFLSQYYQIDREIISVLSILGALVLAYNVLRHSRHVEIAGTNNVKIMDVEVQIQEGDINDAKGGDEN